MYFGRKALVLSMNLDEGVQAKVQLHNARIFSENGKLDSSMTMAENALDYYSLQKDSANLVKVYNVQGVNLDKKGRVDESINLIYEAARICERNGLQRDAIESYNNLAAICKRNGTRITIRTSACRGYKTDVPGQNGFL